MNVAVTAQLRLLHKSPTEKPPCSAVFTRHLQYDRDLSSKTWNNLLSLTPWIFSSAQNCLDPLMLHWLQLFQLVISNRSNTCNCSRTFCCHSNHMWRGCSVADIVTYILRCLSSPPTCYYWTTGVFMYVLVSANLSVSVWLWEDWFCTNVYIKFSQTNTVNGLTQHHVSYCKHDSRWWGILKCRGKEMPSSYMKRLKETVIFIITMHF